MSSIEKVLIPREYLVIESSARKMVFAEHIDPNRYVKGYIPRDVAETICGRELSGCQWFTREESDAMKAHPEYLTEWPE